MSTIKVPAMPSSWCTLCRVPAEAGAPGVDTVCVDCSAIAAAVRASSAVVDAELPLTVDDYVRWAQANPQEQGAEAFLSRAWPGCCITTWSTGGPHQHWCDAPRGHSGDVHRCEVCGLEHRAEA